MSQDTVEGLVAEARAVVGDTPIDRKKLESLLGLLRRAAEIPGRWSAEAYPDPAPDEQQARYLVSSDPDDSFTLYLNVMRPGKRIPPHNHTTWACVAAVEGSEFNAVYERLDGGTGAGTAQLKRLREVEVRPGTGIALMPDDIHSVEIKGDTIIRHLHFYGKALETLGERLMFDLDAGEAKPMPVGVRTKR